MGKCVPEADISAYPEKREIPKAWLPGEAQGLGFECVCAGVLIALKFRRVWDRRENKK